MATQGPPASGYDAPFASAGRRPCPRPPRTPSRTPPDRKPPVTKQDTDFLVGPLKGDAGAAADIASDLVEV